MQRNTTRRGQLKDNEKKYIKYDLQKASSIKTGLNQVQLESAPLHAAIFTYLNFAVLTIVGIIYELLAKLGLRKCDFGEVYNQ
ncbi:hypothetical protein GJ496_005536, partial [Pomphorhynchus laevis]